MTRPARADLTAGEARLMHVLWQVGESDVTGLRARLDDELSPSTIRTLLAILIRKGMVKRRAGTGRAHVYQPATERRTAQRQGWAQLAKRYLRSPTELALHVLEEARLSSSERERLEMLLRKAERDDA